jgi:hypothetical protein
MRFGDATKIYFFIIEGMLGRFIKLLKIITRASINKRIK